LFRSLLFCTFAPAKNHSNRNIEIRHLGEPDPLVLLKKQVEGGSPSKSVGFCYLLPNNRSVMAEGEVEQKILKNFYFYDDDKNALDYK